MKKILMTLAIALGFAAIANADFISGTSFERYLSGGEKSALLNTSKDDLQGDTASFWEEGPTDSFVTNDTSIATEYTGDRPAVQSGESTQNNYLVVDATTTLNRLVNTDQTPTNIVDGLYFDSLVKFTVADAPDLTPETGDKLVVWMQAVGEEEAAQTNLVVTAGYLSAGNASSAKSYVVTTDAPILPDTWHRLTIKAIADIGNSANIPGFVVFIDGKPVTNTEAKGATGSVMDSLNATASVWAGKNALFPSLVVTGASAQSVTSVGFKGSGAVDDLVFTTTAPTFAADGTYFTLTWTPAAYASLKVDGVDVDDIAKGAQNFAFEGTKAFTVAYTLNSGWSTKDPEFSGTWTSGDNTYLFTATAACSATLNAAQALYQVGTDVFGTFEEALAAVKDAGSTGTIKLLGNIVLPYDGEEKLGTAVIDDGNVTIDLNGKKIKGSSLEGYATIHVGGGSVTIIDSVGGGIVEGPTLVEGELTWLGSAVTAGDGSTLLTAGQYDGIVEVGDGQLAITGGSYQGEDGEFYLIDYIDPDNYSATYASGYWTVAPGVTPVTYAVTWDESMPNVGVYATVDDDPIESGNKFEAGTEVVFVVTPDKGYTYVGVEIGTDWKLEEDDTITATFTVGTAALQVAIPAPEAIAPTEFTVTWTSKNVTVTAEAYNEQGSGIIESGATVDAGDSVDFVVLPNDGYEFKTEPDGWKFNGAGAITNTYADINEDLDVEIPEPTVKTYTITYTTGNGAIVTNGVAEYTVETETFSLPVAADIDMTEAVGVTFDGWTNSVGSTVTEVTKGTTGNLEFFAKWTVPGPAEWDIPGTKGGIQALVKDDGITKYVEFTTIAIADGKITVDFNAAKVFGKGETFGLICKDDLTKAETFTVNAVLDDDDTGTAKVGKFVGDVPDMPQLFVVGIGPAAVTE